MKINFANIIIILVLAFAVIGFGNTYKPKGVFSQIVEHKDGELKGLERGNAYTLHPICCEDSLVIQPVISQTEYGTGIKFTISLPPHSTVQVQFVLPESLSSKKYGSVHCSFQSNSLLWVEKNKRLDPREGQVLKTENGIVITLRLGITVDVPENLLMKNYSSFVRVYVKNLSNNFLTIDSARYTVNFNNYDYFGCPDGEIKNLVPGTVYTIDADPFRNSISPQISGKEQGTILEMMVVGDAMARIGFRLSDLPEYLLEQESGGKISCTFDKESVFWNEGYKIINPFEEGDAFLDEDGEFTLRIGMKVTIPETAKPSMYVGQILLNVWYKGLLQNDTRPVLSSTGCAVGTISVSVSKREFQFELEQNYPNPFNPSTNFEFRIANFSAKAGSASGGELVTLKVYDVLGREVATLVNENKQAGKYSVQWSAEGLPSGVYFYKLQAGVFSSVKKLLLMR